MQGIHICTHDSLAAGIEQPEKMPCPICTEKMLVTWVDIVCRNCGFNSEFDTSHAVRALRSRAKIKRSVFAQEMGVKPKTVSVYEHAPMPKKYWEKAKQYFIDYYQKQEQ